VSTDSATAAGRSTVGPWLEGALAGLSGAIAFPLVIPGIGGVPILDFLPRELGIFVAAFFLFRIADCRLSRRRRILASLSGGIIHFAILLYWLDIAMVRYGHMPQWQAIPVLFLLVLFCASFWAALPAIVDLTRAVPRLDGALGFGLAVLFLEWVRGVLFTGFPWGLWGYTQTRNTALLQIASLAGVYGVSWVVAVAGGLAARAWAGRRTPAGIKAGLRLASFLLVSHSIGGVLWWTHKGDTGPGVDVALLQGNVEQSLKNRSEAHREEILARYLRLTEAAERRGAELIIWPEAAWPGKLNTDLQRVPELNATQRPLLVGASAYEWRNREVRAFNSAFWVAPGGRMVGRYDKQHLVPFGEYVPARFVLPVEKFVTGMVDYSSGASAKPVGVPPTGVLICYDGIFPEIAAAEVEEGAQWLVNLTNDGWYGVSSAPYQHRDFYVLRAVETDRWVARAANTGVSAFVSPTGLLSHQTPLDVETVAQARIWPRQSVTVYVRCGDWLPAIAIGAVLGALGLTIGRSRRRPPEEIDNTGMSSTEQAPPTSAPAPAEPPPTLH
jgi:apolipoprotein N-acyltransferase